jgi:hypothetical protein
MYGWTQKTLAWVSRVPGCFLGLSCLEGGGAHEQRASKITGNCSNIVLRTFMNKSLLLASVIAVAALAACGKKEEAPAPVAPTPAPAASAAVEAASAAMPAASEVPAAAAPASEAASK